MPRPPFHHRSRQRGFIHLTTLVLLLVLLVVAVLYRHKLRAQFEVWTQSAAVNVVGLVKGMGGKVGRMIDQALGGGSSAGYEDIMVTPGAFDDLLTSQPDLAAMAHTLPPLRSQVPEQAAGPKAYCTPQLNPTWLDAREAKALHTITTQFSAPGSCGSRFCTPIPRSLND